MFKSLPQKYELSIISEFDMQYANWIFNSHNWEENTNGYFTCKWCNQTRTNVMPISINDKLCLENPKIKELIK